MRNHFMKQATVKVNVLLENALWIAVFERADQAGYAVARVIFGDEPTDPELYEYISTHFYELKFTEPHDFKLIIKRKNYKRMQRDVKREMAAAKSKSSTKTRAQEVLRLALEKNKKARKSQSKAEKEAALEKKFSLRQAKKKQKKRGH